MHRLKKYRRSLQPQKDSMTPHSESEVTVSDVAAEVTPSRQVLHSTCSTQVSDLPGNFFPHHTSKSSVSSSDVNLYKTGSSEKKSMALDVHKAASRQLRELGHGHREFSLLVLPASLLLYIYSCLGETDRLKLSVTCRTLYDLYKNCSVLWRSAMVHMNSDTPYTKVHLNKTEKSVLRVHGHHIRDISFQIMHPRNIQFGNDTYRLLVDSAKRWPLQTMKIIFGNFELEPDNHKWPKHVDDVITTCLTTRNTGQLKTLFIWGSNWVDNDGQSLVVNALKHSSFTSSLTTLYLGHMPPHTFDVNELAGVIARFENLKEMAIHLSHLSDSLLGNFPKHLEKMYIIMNKFDDSAEITNWPSVLASRPKLKVGLLFHGHCHFPSVSQILPSVVPVSTVNIDSPVHGHGHHDSEKELLRQLPMYCLHLKVLTCVYCDLMSDMGQVLIDTVSQCPSLNSLSFDGGISSEAVLTLAKAKTWSRLELNTASIIFTDSRDREEKMQTLCKQVSSVLKREWKPRPRKKCNICQLCTRPNARPLSVHISPRTIKI